MDKQLLREIVIILLIKVGVLFAIWYQFFYDDQPQVSTNHIAQTLFGEQQGEPL